MFLIQLPEYNSFPLNETKMNHFTRNLAIKMHGTPANAYQFSLKANDLNTEDFKLKYKLNTEIRKISYLNTT